RHPGARRGRQPADEGRQAIDKVMPGALLRIDFEERDRHHRGVVAKEETLLWLQFPDRFSPIAGTIFENTNKPLCDWFRVIHMMLTAKKGVSALQVHRTMGFGSYKTAWYMCHRIRTALADKEFKQLLGIVEVDETC